MPLTAPLTLPRPFGNYTLVSSLGRGGMAEVFLASHESLPGVHRLVAIKRIHPHLIEDASFVQMFFDEARVLMGLSHPNIDRILDTGQVDGVPFMALDYVPGRDLALVLKQHEGAGPLPLEVCAHVIAKVAGGLAHAHARRDESGRSLGIVHRDVTPENVIVTFDGGVKILDFGVALGTMRAQVTAPGLIKGKPAYMAPEQLLARRVDHRADVFALGVLLYRISVGRLPFDVVSSDPATYRRLLDDVPPPPHLLRPDYPRSLSVVVMKALEKPLERRYASAAALQADIEEVMAEQGWFPSERRIAQLMSNLFPAAAHAAQRLSDNPNDVDAAQEASHMAAAYEPDEPSARRLADSFDADPDDEPTAMGSPFDTRLLADEVHEDDATVTGGPEFETVAGGPEPETVTADAEFRAVTEPPPPPIPDSWPQAPPAPAQDPFLDARLAPGPADHDEPSVSQQETRTSQSPFVVIEDEGTAIDPPPPPGFAADPSGTSESPTAPRAQAPARRVPAVPPGSAHPRGARALGGPVWLPAPLRELTASEGPLWRHPPVVATAATLVVLALLGLVVCG